MAKSTRKTTLKQDSKAALDSILNPEAKARLQREVSLSQPVKDSSASTDVLEFPSAIDDQDSLQTSKKGKNEIVSKQKAKKAPSGSVPVKPDSDALTLELRGQIEAFGQEQKQLQQTAAQEFEQLRSSLQRLEQSLTAFDSRTAADQEKLREVSEMAAAQQQRMNGLQEILDDRPWLKLQEELRGAVRENLEKVSGMEKFLQEETSKLKKVVQDALQKVADLENQATSRSSESADMERNLSSVQHRLNDLEDHVRNLKDALSAPASAPTPGGSGKSVPAGSSAVAAAQPAAQKDEIPAREWLRRARMLWNGQRFTNPAAAVDLLTKALEADPNSAEMFNERGLAQIDAGFPDKALSDFSRAILLDAKLVSAFHNRGLLYMKLDNRDLACRDFRSAAALGDPRALKMAQETGYCGCSVLIKLFRGVID